jgi:glycosyltransferase involved in cell wall biosynthesis
MINVGFWFDAPLEYTGGLNYLKNLLHALSKVNDGSVKSYIFFGTDAPPSVTRPFEPYATVVRTPILERKTFPWFVHKVLYKVFGSMTAVNRLLKRNGIDVVSHAWYIYKGKPPVKVIAWIPDFQYLHLPELFPNLNPNDETKVNQAIIAQADAVVLSSAHAYADFLRVAHPEHQGRGQILRFVCQPARTRAAESAPELPQLESKYGFSGPFFLLPNQFWSHKNHLLVLQAVAALKERGVYVQVLCTGNTKDYRLEGTPYVDSLRRFIAAHGLDKHVRILGMIDYGDLLTLMRHAVGVINPSRFEGWSSSVEEARSMGKTILLSRIPVHVEQAPPDAHYFDVDDVEALATALERVATTHDRSRHAKAEEAALAQLGERTEAFGKQYFQLLKQVLQGTGTECTP